VLESQPDYCDAACSITWGFRLVLLWSIFSVFCLINALLSAYQHLKDVDRGSYSYMRRHDQRYGGNYDRRIGAGGEGRGGRIVHHPFPGHSGSGDDDEQGGSSSGGGGGWRGRRIMRSSAVEGSVAFATSGRDSFASQ
jgi:hypothetical protein